uniref:Large ribosomal subunit protein uL23c n=1 Tax=Corydalis saxicola TaxID=282776 RepID=A0A8B0R4B4_CORSX|nr:ribosomal protein L23 [Corydalis saxicola]QTW90232.1 ribosomal protein L23 [Corydalis saxicola]QTW90410.1 ribosomal protein L23 [Corydalis saxicola]QTW90416.1 ribosomal protein L23 [Corydalis saxicola]
MDGIKSVVTEKSVRLLVGKNQYTSNVESGSTRTEIKHWVELFFGVKVIAMNSHRLPGKGRRMGPIMGHTRHYRRMIITLQPGYYIPFPFFVERKELQSNYLMKRRYIYTKLLPRAHAMGPQTVE